MQTMTGKKVKSGTAPAIPVAPGPSKTLDRFGADRIACQQYAAAKISPAAT
jgi:hypothetical protein